MLCSNQWVFRSFSSPFDGNFLGDQINFRIVPYDFRMNCLFMRELTLPLVVRGVHFSVCFVIYFGSLQFGTPTFAKIAEMVLKCVFCLRNDHVS